MISYAITDPQNFSFDTIDNDLNRISKKADFIVYRDKKNQNYDSDAEIFLEKALKYPFEKVLLHRDVALAAKLSAGGVHLTGKQFDDIEIAKKFGLFVVISCHTSNDAKNAQNLGADMITYSPIFSTPNKGKPLGLGAIKELQGIISIPIIALGGILTEAQIDACERAGASGFASIRYFNSEQK